MLLACSRPDGVMLLQAITIDDRANKLEKAWRSFIKTHIFPGGCRPSLEVIARNVARRTDMQTLDLEDLTLHSAQTLRVLAQNFTAAPACWTAPATTSGSGASGC